MDPRTDLTPDALQSALPGRPLRAYPALVSTGSAARAWAIEGAPAGAVVIAGHQLAPRGHAGLPLEQARGEGVGFSLVMRPSLPAAREGWLYTVVLSALADAFGEGSTIEWPAELWRDGARVAAAGINARIGQGHDEIEWAIADVLLPGAAPPRGELLCAVLGAIDARAAGATEAVLGSYELACETVGRHVRVRLRAGTAPRVEGRAAGILEDGAVVLEKADGRKVPVRPQDVRSCERV